MSDKKITEKLKDLIASKGIKHTVIAKKTGYSTQNLNRLLNSNDIKFSQLEAICQALDTNVYNFLVKDYLNTGHYDDLQRENQELKEEKRRIVKNSIGFDQLRKIEKLVEQKAQSGLGLVYFEFDSINNFFPLIFAPLKSIISESDYILVEKCAVQNYLEQELSVRGFVLENIR